MAKGKELSGSLKWLDCNRIYNTEDNKQYFNEIKIVSLLISLN